MKKFIFYLILSGIIFSVIKNYGANHKFSNNSGKLSELIIKVKTHGIRERYNELRKIGTNPIWMREDVAMLIERLNEGEDFDGEVLTNRQEAAILSALSYAGRDSVSGTGIIKKVLLKTDDSEVIEAAIIALTRVKSIPESLEDLAPAICGIKNDTYKCELVEFLLYRLDLLPSQKKLKIKEQIKAISNQILEYPKKCDLANDTTIFNKEKNDLLKISIAGELSHPALESILDALKLNCANKTFLCDFRITILKTVSDLKDLDKEVIQELSLLMQYDSDPILREESLLSLRRIGSEDSLAQIHAYGHKFKNGEVKPKNIEPHPFLSWALKIKKENKIDTTNE